MSNSLEIGDTIQCGDKNATVQIMTRLAHAGVSTDFLYEKDGKKGLWLIVTDIGGTKL